MFSVFTKLQVGKHTGLMDFLKTLIVFFQKPRKSKNALYYQKNLQFLCEIDQKVSIFVEKLKKMQPPKMTFSSQIESSIKSYECFMFLQNFRVEITLDWWILERPIPKNDFCTQNVVKNAYLNEFTISLRNWPKRLNFCWKTQKNVTSKNDQ